MDDRLYCLYLCNGGRRTCVIVLFCVFDWNFSQNELFEYHFVQQKLLSFCLKMFFKDFSEVKSWRQHLVHWSSPIHQNINKVYLVMEKQKQDKWEALATVKSFDIGKESLLYIVSNRSVNMCGILMLLHVALNLVRVERNYVCAMYSYMHTQRFFVTLVPFVCRSGRIIDVSRTGWSHC